MSGALMEKGVIGETPSFIVRTMSLIVEAMNVGARVMGCICAAMRLKVRATRAIVRAMSHIVPAMRLITATMDASNRAMRDIVAAMKMRVPAMALIVQAMNAGARAMVHIDPCDERRPLVGATFLSPRRYRLRGMRVVGARGLRPASSQPLESR
jgi:hypothetical protein